MRGRALLSPGLCKPSMPWCFTTGPSVWGRLGSWNPGGVSHRWQLDGETQGEGVQLPGLPALNHVSPVPAETPVQMVWQLLYVVCLPELCGLQGNRFTPECWGLRNPPGGQCSPGQEVSRSRAVLLTQPTRPPAQPASCIAAWLADVSRRRSEASVPGGKFVKGKPQSPSKPLTARHRAGWSVATMGDLASRVFVQDAFLPCATCLGEDSGFRGLSVICKNMLGKAQGQNGFTTAPPCASSAWVFGGAASG